MKQRLPVNHKRLQNSNLHREIFGNGYSRVLASIIASSLLSGCFGANKTVVIKDIGSFGEAISTASVLYKEFYASLNNDDIKTFNLILSSSPECKLEPVYGASNAFCPKLRNWGDSPYTQSLIPVEALAARMDLLETMALYSAALASLATDDSPSRFRTSVQDLSGSILSVQDRFSKLEANAPQGIVSPKDYIGPISAIVKVTGGLALETARWSAIRRVVLESDIPVTTILDYLSSDLKAVESLYKRNQDRKFIELERYYQSMQSKPSFSRQQRAELLDQMSALHLARQKLAIASPATALDNIRKAHQKLVSAARTNELSNISELRTYLAAFETDLIAIRDAIYALRTLK